MKTAETLINLEAKKVEVISRITRLIDYKTLLKIEKLLSAFEEDTEEWETLSPKDRERLEKGLSSINQGKVLSNAAVKERIGNFIKAL